MIEYFQTDSKQFRSILSSSTKQGNNWLHLVAANVKCNLIFVQYLISICGDLNTFMVLNKVSWNAFIWNVAVNIFLRMD
jgi:hypothetical protein